MNAQQLYAAIVESSENRCAVGRKCDARTDGGRAGEAGKRLPAGGVLPTCAMPLQDVERHEELAARGVERERLEQSRHRLRKAGMVGERADVRLAAGRKDLNMSARRV